MLTFLKHVWKNWCDSHDLECRNTPGTLKALTAALFAAGPALVYLVPDNSTPLVVAQVLGALLCVVGGSAAWGGATLIGALQKD